MLASAGGGTRRLRQGAGAAARRTLGVARAHAGALLLREGLHGAGPLRARPQTHVGQLAPRRHGARQGALGGKVSVSESN